MGGEGAERERGGDRGSKVGSDLTAGSPMWGSNSQTVRSWPELVGCSTDWATQVHLGIVIFKMLFWRLQCVASIETTDPQDKVQTPGHGVQDSPNNLLLISPDWSPSAYSLSSSPPAPSHSLNTPCTFMLLWLHTCSSSVQKALSACWLHAHLYSRLTQPKHHLHLEGFLGLPR